MCIVDSGSFNAQFFGLTVDAFARSALIVGGFVERGLSIKEHALESTY